MNDEDEELSTELPFEQDEKPPPNSYDRFFEQQLKRKKAARQAEIEFAVESYEHPVYGIGVRPCWK